MKNSKDYLKRCTNFTVNFTVVVHYLVNKLATTYVCDVLNDDIISKVNTFCHYMSRKLS